MAEPVQSHQVTRTGAYWYTDTGMGSPREKVQVVRLDGRLQAVFRDEENGDAHLDLEPLSGLFDGPL